MEKSTETRLVISGAREADKVVITFRDFGPGIPEAHFVRIFDPFLGRKRWERELVSAFR